MRQEPAVRPADLRDRIEQWVASGVISPAQAARMRADLAMPATLTVVEAPPGGEHHRGSLAIEGLGYLGSVLIVVASVLLATEYWDDTSVAVHLAVVAAAAALLLLAGLAIPRRLGAAGQRLHAVLWLGATVGTAAFAGVFGDEVLGWHDEDEALLIFAVASAAALVLWWRFPAIAQHAAVVVALAGAAGSVAAQLPDAGDHLPGVAIWGVGASWFVLGWGGVARPRWTALLLAGIALLIGSGMAMQADGGVVLALGTVTALVALAVAARDLLVLGIGAWGALQILPIAVERWFPGQLAAALALLATGVLLVVAAMWIARLRKEPVAARHDYSAIPARAAGFACAGVFAAVTTVVVVLGIAG